MKAYHWLALTSLFSTLSFAEDISILGNFQQEIHLPSPVTLSQSSQHQSVSLMRVGLSEKAQKRFVARVQETRTSALAKLSGLPPSVQLGMENVPVLNQGIHGSCVTFAVTAAIDAVIKKGDYISQLCPLQLGQYLQENGFSPSGWDGSLGINVLSQLDMFGVMTKQDQRAFGCGGLTDYPLISEDKGQEMNASQYHEYSHSLVSKRIAWTSVLDLFQITQDKIDSAITLSQVKQTLARGDRLVIGVLLVNYVEGLAGAIGTHKAFNDTWLLTPEIIDDLNENPQFAGHEMVVTGYDDNAYAKDNFGRIHRGLITLRNSWGDKLGDQGTFYMSYDYFRALIMEVQRIRQLGLE
ncbi:MAG: peptidase C1 [Gammaproteobacteria bacterium]|nr:peptidase C1 [Gammaproteobacteria bacterium]